MSNLTGKKTYGGSHLADYIFRKRVLKKMKTSGMSMNQFSSEVLGKRGSSGPAWLSFFFKGKRSPMLWHAIDIANRLNIDLGKIQRMVKNELDN